MIKKYFQAAAAVVGLVFICSLCYAAAADTGTGAQSKIKAAPASKMMAPRNRVNISMSSGKIESIDSANPANVQIKIKEDNGKVRTIVADPKTNVTKITSASDLKPGDEVRAMIRNVEGKESAIGILYGDLKKLPPIRPAHSVPPQAGVKQEPKK